LVESIQNARIKYGFLILGYVIMPEHVHIVILPIDGTPIGKVVGEIKSFTARNWFSENPFNMHKVKGVFWQRRCHDHNCRTSNAVKEKITYCHMNPVRKGYVEKPEDWIWSSYNWYLGEENVPLEMDVIEI